MQRDELSRDFGVLAIEMEGSGIADGTWNAGSNYILVRGICDYCDPEKDDSWQAYVATTAAAYTTALISACGTPSSTMLLSGADLRLTSV